LIAIAVPLEVVAVALAFKEELALASVIAPFAAFRVKVYELAPAARSFESTRPSKVTAKTKTAPMSAPAFKTVKVDGRFIFPKDLIVLLSPFF
jgi:hypothetical protein